MMTDYLNQLKAQYDALLPPSYDALLPPSVAAGQAFDAWVDVEYTYESNASEGNTLTRGETGILFDKGLPVGISRIFTTQPLIARSINLA
jgi:hypothetical protein